MTKEKRLLYQKAYVELYEMIKLLSDEEREKIPEYFIEYLYNNMDTNYKFSLDTEKGLLEQDYMVETKALLVELFNKYLANDTEKEILDKYKKISIEQLDKKKSVEYGADKLFESDDTKPEHVDNASSLVEVEHESFIKKIFRKVWQWIKFR